MVRPQMSHASLAVLAIPSSIAPEQTSPAYDRFPLVYCLEALDLHPVCPDLDNKAGRGVSQSLCYFHVTLYQFFYPVMCPVDLFNGKVRERCLSLRHHLAYVVVRV